MPTLRLPGLLLLALLLPATNAAAQTQTFSTPYSQAELDRMLAPVALYPDSVLAQLLIAATYPLEVMEAAYWSREHPGLEGDAAVAAVENRDWHPGVKAMVAFPDVIDRMDQHIDWTTHLGDAFLQQEAQVMATIQSLREHALNEGHLKSTDTIRVYREPEVIIIEPLYPRVVYVPYYDPWVVYGHWWHPHHPPYYWAAPHGYYRTSVFYWGSGINFSFGFYYSNFDWHHRHVVVHKHHHDHQFHKHRPGKPFYKHADYKKNYRHWRPEHRQRVHVEKRHFDLKRRQLDGDHDRQRYDRGPDRREAGRHEHNGQRFTRADDIRHRLRSFGDGADNRRDRVERGTDRKPDRFAVSDRRIDRDQLPDRRFNDQRRVERTRPQGNERDHAAVERIRTNLERHQRHADDNRVRRQPDGPANRTAAFQRERSVNNDRRPNDARTREIRQSPGNQSLKNKRPAASRPGERSLQNRRRDDGRAGANNRPRPSFDNRSALNQRQARDIQTQRRDNGARRDMNRRPRQSLSNAGHNRPPAAGRAVESRRGYDRDRAISPRRTADRQRSAGPERRGHAGGGRDFSVAGKGRPRR